MLATGATRIEQVIWTPVAGDRLDERRPAPFATPAELRARPALVAPGRSAREHRARSPTRYAVAITPAMAALIDPDDPDDPIARQFVPDAAELERTPEERADPIGDVAHSPVEGIVHRYPDRVLLKAVHVCPVYCRFCFRREMVGPQGLGTLSPEAHGRGVRLYRRPSGDLGGDPHRRRSAGAVAAPARRDHASGSPPSST